MTKDIVVITGGAGFIGSHTVDLFVKQGFRVHIIDDLISGREANLQQHNNNPDVLLEIKDIRQCKADDHLFSNAKYIVHFAGIGDLVPSIENPIDYMSVNVQGTINILECARAHSNTLEKFVYAASSSCYGLADTPTSESHRIQPEHPYALSKNLGEQACLHWSKIYKLPVNVIRIFNAYGPRSRTSGAYGAVIGVFLRQKLASKPFTVVGDGNQTRDFIFVSDVARAFFEASVTSLNEKIWNVGAGNPRSVNELVRLLGGDCVFIPKRPGEPDSTHADISRIKKDLGWSPQVSFEQGINEIIKNIEYWRDAPLWDTRSIEKATEGWFRYLSK